MRHAKLTTEVDNLNLIVTRLTISLFFLLNRKSFKGVLTEVVDCIMEPGHVSRTIIRTDRLHTKKFVY